MKHASAYSAGGAIRALEQQVAEQAAEIEWLKAELAAARSIGAPHPYWLEKLTGSQRRLMATLVAANGCTVDRYDLLLAMVGEESDASLGVLSVQVHHIRRQLGRDAIEGVRGVGYRLGAALRKPTTGATT